MKLNAIQKPALLIILISLIIRLITIGNNDLLVEEAYYWNYSTHLDFGYLDHPPMVALLIKLSTLIFGTTEFGVRLPSILCWLLTALFSYKLTEKIAPSAGIFSVMLLAILPFFFLHSLVITPDLPLIVCWSAALYYLYNALVLEKPKAWLAAGVFLGLGLLSKYSIVLLGPATLIYLILDPKARYWFTRKEPYLCVCITALLFTPVIYWNARHEWASFLFQSTRRFQESPTFSFHELLGLFILFLTPLGVLGFIRLFKKTNATHVKTAYFIKIFTLIPLIVFSLFSLRHPIKFNWIGPSLLALIPWLALLIKENQAKLLRPWIITSTILLICYIGFIVAICFGVPHKINNVLFNKFIAWQDLTKKINQIASNTHQNPILVPLDRYNIASELAFYQAKLLNEKLIPQLFDVIGSHIFGGESLMYRYWAKDADLNKRTLILITNNLIDFNNPAIHNNTTLVSEPKHIWSKSQGAMIKLRPYYYEVVVVSKPIESK